MACGFLERVDKTKPIFRRSQKTLLDFGDLEKYVERVKVIHLIYIGKSRFSGNSVTVNKKVKMLRSF